MIADHKRLPSYNFGLGKRGAPDSRMYSFGLGKRLAYNIDSDSLLADQNEDASIDKRGKQYSFGLGKRLKQYSFGLGKRSGHDSADYEEYVKRGGENHNRFSFGIGKRDIGEAAYEDLVEKLAAARYHQKQAEELSYH